MECFQIEFVSELLLRFVAQLDADPPTLPLISFIISGLRWERIKRGPRSRPAATTRLTLRNSSPATAGELSRQPTTLSSFETRSFPTRPRCYPRSFTFYVAFPSAPFSFCALIQASTRSFNRSKGIAPPSRISSWNAFRSNLSPSSFFASSRSAKMVNCPIL